jgi:Holliday junction resolvase RusA-like endonuclease
MIHIIVPGEPIAQARPRFARRGGGVVTYTPSRQVRYMDTIVMCAREAEGWPSEPWTGPVGLAWLAVFARPKRLMRRSDSEGAIPHTSRPDGDNLEKMVLDALTYAGLWRDDAQVAVKLGAKVYAPKGGTPSLRIWATQDLDRIAAMLSGVRAAIDGGVQCQH